MGPACGDAGCYADSSWTYTRVAARRPAFSGDPAPVESTGRAKLRTVGYRRPDLRYTIFAW